MNEHKTYKVRISQDTLEARSRLGVASRRGGDPEAAQAARRDLRAAVLADRIREAVAAAPPFTDEQTDRLAALLRGGA